MRIKKILSLAVVLAMVLTVVPVFGLTAGAASYAKGAETFSIEFDLVDITETGGDHYADIGITDIDGNVFTAFCYARDGFFPNDGERSYNESGNNAPNSPFKEENNANKNTRTSSAVAGFGEIDHIKITYQKTESGYTMSYSSGEHNGEATYTGTVNGISTPDKWKYAGTGTSISAKTVYAHFKNIKISTDDAVYESKTVEAPIGGYTEGFKADNSLNGKFSDDKLIIIDWGSGDNEYRAGIIAFSLDLSSIDSSTKGLYAKLNLTTSNYSNAKEFPIYAINPEWYTGDGLKDCTYTDVTGSLKVCEQMPDNGLNSFYLDLNEYLKQYPEADKVVLALVGRTNNQQNTQFNVAGATLSYEVRDKATVTVKYQSGDEDINDSATVDGFVGDSVAIPSEEVITKGDKTYVRESEPETHLIEKAADEVIVKYTEDTIDSFETIPEVTVIDGNAPLLPATVKGTLKTAQTQVTVPVEWETDSLTVGENTVKGTVDGTDVQPEVTVTVLSSDVEAESGVISLAGGQLADGGSAHMFAPVVGKATFEFDVTFVDFNNMDGTITIGDSSMHKKFGENFHHSNYPIFGDNGDAISIQVNNKGLNVRTWDGGSPTEVIGAGVVEQGKKYRFFVTTDTEAQTYTVKITDENGTVVKDTVEDIHYRSDSTKQLDTLVVTNNNEHADLLTVENFRIHWEDKDNYYKATFEYKENGDGEVLDTVYRAAKTGETASVEAVAEYKGTAKAVRSSSGNNIWSANSAEASDTSTVTVTAVKANNADVPDVKNGSTIVVNGRTYDVKSDNLIPNGDFSHNFVGWYGQESKDLNTETGVNEWWNIEDGVLKHIKEDKSGQTSPLGRLNTYWDVEANKTYLFTLRSAKTPVDTSTNKFSEVIFPVGESKRLETAYETLTADNFIFTTGEEAGTVGINFRWIVDGEYDDFGLYEVMEKVPVDNMFDYRVLENKNETLTEGANGFDVGPLNWGDTNKNGVLTMKFNVPAAEDGKKLAEANIHFTMPSIKNENNPYVFTVYAIDPEKADFEGNKLNGESFTVDNWAGLVNAIEIGKEDVTISGSTKKNYAVTVKINLGLADFKDNTVALALVVTGHRTSVAGTAYEEGKYAPYLTDVTAETALTDTVGAPTLGWEDGKGLTINYAAAAGQTLLIYHEDAVTGELVPARAVTVGDDNTGVAVYTANTNRIYGAAVYDKVAGTVSDEAKASIYSLVVDEVLKDYEAIDEAKLSAINEVIANGGIYYAGAELSATEDLTEEAQKIMSVEEGKININSALTELGIGFVYNDGNIYIGSEATKATDVTVPEDDSEKTGTYGTMEIKDNAITLSNPVTAGIAEAITLSLDSVNIEFIETLIEEAEADGVNADVGMVPEI